MSDDTFRSGSPSARSSFGSSKAGPKGTITRIGSMPKPRSSGPRPDWSGPGETDDTGATQTQGDPLAGPNAKELGRP